MKLLSHRNARILGASVGCCAIGFGISACGSSSSGGSPDSSTGGPGACTTTNALTIAFNPMYSAFISSTSQHKFLVPAIVTGISGATVTWSASDPTAVDFTPDPMTGGTTITVHKSGPITITAQAGNLCGSAPLTVTQNTEADWSAGNGRYNNSNGLMSPFGMGRGDGGMPMGPPPNGFRVPSPTDPSPFEPADGGPGPACTNCHGPTATMGIFNGIEHTPEQTAGFSDQELTDIIVNGIIPDGGYYDPSIIPYQFWQFFHKWRDMTPDQQKGIVCYLRSLTPTKQYGHLDFNGIRMMMMGGGPPPPMNEAGPSDEAGTTDDAGTVPEAGADSSPPTGDATTD